MPSEAPPSAPPSCQGIQRLLALSDRFLALQPDDSDGAADLSDDVLSSGCIRSLVEVSRLTGASIPHFVNLREHSNKETASRAGEVTAYILTAKAVPKVVQVAAEAARLLGGKRSKAVARCAQRFAWAAAALLSTCATACKALANGITIGALPQGSTLSRHAPSLTASSSLDTLLHQLTEPSLLLALADCIRASTSTSATSSPSSPSPSLPCHGAPHLGLLAWSARLAHDTAWLARRDVMRNDMVNQAMQGLGIRLASMLREEPRHVPERLVAGLASSRVLEALAEALLALSPLPEDSTSSSGGCDPGCVLVSGVGCGRADAAELVCAVCSMGSCCHSLGVLLGEVCGKVGALRHEALGLQLAGVLMAPAVQRLMECMVRRAVGDVEGGGSCGWALLDALKLATLVDESVVGSVPPAKLFGVEQLSVSGAQGQGQRQQQQQQRAPGVGRELVHATLLCGPLTVWTCALRLRLRNPEAVAATVSRSSNADVTALLAQLSAMAPDPAASLEATCAALRATCLLYRTHPQLRGGPPCGAVQTLWALRAPMPNVHGCHVYVGGAPVVSLGGRKHRPSIVTSLGPNPVLHMELLAPGDVARCLPAALEAVAWGLAAACDIGVFQREEDEKELDHQAASAAASDKVPEWSWVAKSLVAGLWASVEAVGQGCAAVDAADAAHRLARARLLRSLETFVRLYGEAAYGMVSAEYVMPGLSSAVRALCVLPLPLVQGAVPPPWAAAEGQELVPGGDEAGVPLQQQQQQAGDLCGLLLSLGKLAASVGSSLEAVEYVTEMEGTAEAQQRGTAAHLDAGHALDDLVGGMVVMVDRAVRLAAAMEGPQSGGATDGSGGSSSSSAAEPAALRGCVVYAVRGACWAAAHRFLGACRVLGHLPEAMGWPDFGEDERGREDPALQVSCGYPTRAAYVQGAVNTLSTTAAWLGCPLGAWLGEWRQLLPARPVQLLEAGCKFVATVAGEVGTGGGPRGGAAQGQQVRMAVQGAGALQGALVGLAAHADDATVQGLRGWLVEGAGVKEGSEARSGDRVLLDLAVAVKKAVDVCKVAGQLGAKELECPEMLSQLVRVLRAPCGTVGDFRRKVGKLGKEWGVGGGGEGSSGGGGGGGGGEVQRVWGREQADAAVRAAGEVWWPKACANPECRTLKGPTEAELKSKLCAGCGEARYCRPECQKEHWRAAHKHECRKKGG